MKIDEAVKFINGTNTAFAEVEDGDLIIFEHNRVSDDWFLRFPTKAKTWRSIIDDEDCLTDVEPQDLARVMDVIQRLLDTPVEERFPESKYTVQVLADYDESFLNVGKDDGFAFFKDEVEAGSVQTQFTQAEIDELKQRDDLAIDWDKAIIEPVEGDE